MSGGGLSLQDRYAPRDRCFGCGPANERGLRIKSHVVGEEVVAEWTPEPHHEAFEGVVNGGVVGALFDCHSSWTAAWYLMRRDGAAEPPCIVTSEFHVSLVWPTSSAGPVRLRAWVVEERADRAVVEAALEAAGRTTSYCRGTFIAVRENHPAFHRR
jgi:acyl-coenzyme A thioesterase PaaI-like protein